MVGNGSEKVELEKLRLYHFNVSPWIFWPRRPMILEKYLDEKGIVANVDRHIESIFIGNFENSYENYAKGNEILGYDPNKRKENFEPKEETTKNIVSEEKPQDSLGKIMLSVFTSKTARKEYFQFLKSIFKK